MLRFFIASGLAIAALTMVLLAVWFGEEGASVPDMLLNLGAEILGIALTVAIVDWLIERKKMADEAQRLAWRILHEIDQAVWVWQGGRQEFHLDELAALINLIAEADAPIESTQDLFVNLGRTASDSLRLNAKLVRSNNQLRGALEGLTGLAQMRALKGRMPRSFVVGGLQRSVEALAAVTGQAIHAGTFAVAKTFWDASPQAQNERYQGWRYGGSVPRTASGGPSGPSPEGE